MDEPAFRHRVLELGPDLVDIHVDRPVAVPERPAPDERVEVLAPHGAAGPPGEGGEDAELAARHGDDPAGDDHQPLLGTDLEAGEARDAVLRYGSHAATMPRRRFALVTDR